jgi:hypothetical protein
MNSKEALKAEIEQLYAQIKPREAALRAIEKAEVMAQGSAQSPATRFFNARPLDAINELLRGRGKPIQMDELRSILVEGGITIGKGQRPLQHQCVR